MIRITGWVDDCDTFGPYLELTVSDPEWVCEPGTVFATPTQALDLITGLLDTVNQALPPEQRIYLGPPGFEYVTEGWEGFPCP
ncbi:MAG TPA: hypothetical protein VIY28_14960 [Pseudonocardiaceae bacterium]